VKKIESEDDKKSALEVLKSADEKLDLVCDKKHDLASTEDRREAVADRTGRRVERSAGKHGLFETHPKDAG
jgi:hypothetical protein